MSVPSSSPRSPAWRRGLDLTRVASEGHLPACPSALSTLPSRCIRSSRYRVPLGTRTAAAAEHRNIIDRENSCRLTELHEHMPHFGSLNGLPLRGTGVTHFAQSASPPCGSGSARSPSPPCDDSAFSTILSVPRIAVVTQLGPSPRVGVRKSSLCLSEPHGTPQQTDRSLCSESTVSLSSKATSEVDSPFNSETWSPLSDQSLTDRSFVSEDVSFEEDEEEEEEEQEEQEKLYLLDRQTQLKLAEKEVARKVLQGTVHCCRMALPPGPREDKADLFDRFKLLRGRLEDEIDTARLLGVAEEELHGAHLWKRRVHNAIEDLKGQLRVFCRVRPLSTHEQYSAPLEVVPNGMSIRTPTGGTLQFDGVFAPGGQVEIFRECQDLVRSAVDGRNVTILACGQTGAGKTHTMYGSDGDQEGILPRTIKEIFDVIAKSNDRADSVVSVSMLELYKNQLIDLLVEQPEGGVGDSRRDEWETRDTTHGVMSSRCTTARWTKLQVRQDKEGSVQVDGLTEQGVQDAEEVLELMRSGTAKRKVSNNKLNEQSSRSHLIFTIQVRSVDQSTGEHLRGKVLLCDLAGSERLKKSESVKERKKEAIEINRALTSLGDVVQAISVGQRLVPYRNHKLTQILQDSIGGSAKTLMFVNLSPAPSDRHETMMSLQYAARAKGIVNGRRASAPL